MVEDCRQQRPTVAPQIAFMITGTGVHDRPESLFTIDRNRCSRSTGLDVHDQTESLFTIHRNAQEQKNPYLEEYFDDKFSLERALKHAITYRRATSRYPSLNGPGADQYYQLYSFAFAVVRAHARSSSRGQTRLCGSLKDGLKNDNGLAPVALEMAVAVHLWTADFDVEFTDMEGRGQFDFFASAAGIELEIDWKAVSGDIGRSIHRNRMLDLLPRCQPAIQTCLARRGGTILRITIPAALHAAEDYMVGVAASRTLLLSRRKPSLPTTSQPWKQRLDHTAGAATAEPIPPGRRTPTSHTVFGRWIRFIAPLGG